MYLSSQIHSGTETLIVIKFRGAPFDDFNNNENITYLRN